MTIEDIETIVYELAAEFFKEYPDPMPRFAYLGEHGRGLIESALAAPRQTFGGRYLHRTTVTKAAALFRSLTKNHGLIDGNKRLALTTLTVFLMFNGYIFWAPANESVRFTVRVANPEEDVTLREIERWIRRYSFNYQRQDTLAQMEKIPTKDLRQHLHRINAFRRTVEKKRKALERDG